METVTLLVALKVQLGRLGIRPGNWEPFSPPGDAAVGSGMTGVNGSVLGAECWAAVGDIPSLLVSMPLLREVLSAPRCGTQSASRS